MEQHFPVLLSRKQAMIFVGRGRKFLENFATKHNVRVYVTKGGHRRYFRDDLAKHLNEKL
jgi:hypothetical protein